MPNFTVLQCLGIPQNNIRILLDIGWLIVHASPPWRLIFDMFRHTDFEKNWWILSLEDVLWYKIISSRLPTIGGKVRHFIGLWDFNIGWVIGSKLSVPQLLIYLIDFYVLGLIRKHFECFTRRAYNISLQRDSFNVEVKNEPVARFEFSYFWI